MTTRGIVVFDVDGTLCNTNEVDESCMAEAVRDVLGVSDISTDWGAYRFSTDNGIVSEIIQTRCGRAPTMRDLREVRARFIELIHQRGRQDANVWTEVAGAAAVLRELASTGWQVAIATGGWGPSARHKLDRSNISIVGVPFACADHAFERVDIIRWAVRSITRIGKIPTIPVVYVGDGVWDIHAAKSGGFGFIGIGHGERASRLAAAGCSLILPDYCDRSRFEQALISASSNH